MMGPEESVGRLEMECLLAVCELSGAQAKTGVCFQELQERLGCTAEDASRCCDYWAKQGFLEWPARHHVALTHVGLSACMRYQDHPEESLEAALLGKVSVVIPALNEAGTVGYVVRQALRDPRVGEILVVDDGSIDGTAEAAASAGATVMMSTFLGKGASMQDGLSAAEGEVVLFLDGDLTDVSGDVVRMMTDPVLSDEADFVKARFTRDAGRVTVLTAKPLLGSFFPELSSFDQPLGGIVALRRSTVGGIELERDYGVDVGLLIDAAVKGCRMAEVDIGRIDHNSQSLESLGEMAKEVTRVILDRAWKHGRLKINQVREIQEIERRSRAEVQPVLADCEAEVKYALFDMDGVLLDGRFVQAMAERVGVTGELELFLDNRSMSDADRTRLIASLFVGVYRELFEETALAMPLMDGAVETVLALRKAGYRVGVVTDSFAVAAETVRRRVFADFAVAHVLHFHNGVATGEVAISSSMSSRQGCPHHEICKANVVDYLRSEKGLVPEETIAVGDGENDICMLKQVGRSVAFQPKSEAVAEAAEHVVTGSLCEILPLVLGPGIPGSDGSDGGLEECIHVGVSDEA